MWHNMIREFSNEDNNIHDPTLLQFQTVCSRGALQKIYTTSLQKKECL